MNDHGGGMEEERRRRRRGEDQTMSVKDAVHKLQLSLFQGIRNQDQLFSAGSLMSRPDYQDVVTERTIADLCGYPLCTHSLPSHRPRKGRYRISLKDHTVYDLRDTYMFCSSACLLNSRAFAATLRPHRCSVASPAKIDDIFRLFGDLSLESEVALVNNVDLGFPELKIQEKAVTEVGQVSLQNWIGPSNAIEGYVPLIDRLAKPLRSETCKNDSKSSDLKVEDAFINELDFMSTIITEDEYSISKSPGSMEVVTEPNNLNEFKGIAQKKDLDAQFKILETASVPLQNTSHTKPREAIVERTRTVEKAELSIPKVSSSPCDSTEAKEETLGERLCQSIKTMRKSSLKSKDVKKPARSVTWADAKNDCVATRNLCDVQEIGVTEEGAEGLKRTDVIDDDNSSRFSSAEACAMALSQAAEALASGEIGVSGAGSESGIIILPQPYEMEECGHQDETGVYEPEMAPPMWPRKPGMLNTDFFDSEDSWYDTPPDGFSLTLSPFATLWNALFAWMTSSSLAYIYGRDESTHEDFLLLNGREYPRKVVLSDGRSSEIKQTLASCLSRALPGLVNDLRLPTPLSCLEQGLGHLLDTMSFMDAVPSLRMKQWQVLGVLFIEALSVSRLPALAPHMTSRRLLLYKVLDGARVSVEEFEAMKDIIIPLGRVPHFSSQSGG